MSNLWAETYDYPTSVTLSNTADDPAGPFAGLLVNAAGNLVVWPVNGPLASGGVTIAVVAGEYIRFPVKRIGTGSPSVLGLVSAIQYQGK
jgi:hypothetical protein